MQLVSLLILMALSAVSVLGINAFPTSISVSYQIGDSASPPARNISVTGAQAFAVSLATNPTGWLGVSPLSGTVPAVLVVTFSPQGMTAGRYQGIITITDPNNPGFGGSITVGVYLDVVQPIIPNQSLSGTIPHITDGGNWKTIVTLTNVTNFPQQVVVRFWDQRGASMTLPVVGLPDTKEVWFDLPPYGGGYFETPGVNGTITSGWATVEGVPANSVIATTVFRNSYPGRQDTEASVPMSAAARRRFFIAFDHTSGFTSGVAMVNPLSQRVTVAVTFRNGRGVVLQNTSLSLAAGEQIAFSMSDQFRQTSNQFGSAEFNVLGGVGVCVIGLRFNPSGAVTYVPPAFL